MPLFYAGYRSSNVYIPMNNREQDYIDDLESRVEHLYMYTERNVPYRGKGKCGELDLIGYIRGTGQVDLYEVKSTNNPRSYIKAKKQLNRARRCAPYKVRDTYIYIGNIKYLVKHTY